MKYISSLFGFIVIVSFLVPQVLLADPGDHRHPPRHTDAAQTSAVTDTADTDREAMRSQIQSLLDQLITRLVALLEEQGIDLDISGILASSSSSNTDSSSSSDSSDTDESTSSGTASDIYDAYLYGLGDATITTDSNYRYVVATGLPNYTISGGHFATEESEQDIDVRMPLEPEQNNSATYYMIPFTFGVAVNGVLFEPFAAEWYEDDRSSGWQEDPFVTLRGFDDSNAHVQPSGLYHYHGLPEQLLDGYESGDHSPIVGFAGDGFPVYYLYSYEDAEDTDSDIVELESGWELKSGTRPDGPGGSYDGTYNEDYEFTDAGDLDECNGRWGITPEYPDGTYYYVLTEEYPYVPRCLMGDIDDSFVKATPGGA